MFVDASVVAEVLRIDGRVGGVQIAPGSFWGEKIAIDEKKSVGRPQRNPPVFAIFATK